MSNVIFDNLDKQFQTIFDTPRDVENCGIIKIYKGSPPKSAEDPVDESKFLGEFVPLNLMETDLSFEQIESFSEVKEEDVERVATEICKIVEREVKKAMMG